MCFFVRGSSPTFVSGPGFLHAPCKISVDRPSTPGDADAVFCVVMLGDTGPNNMQQAVPVGTGFAISNTHVFTARHNCFGDGEDVQPNVGLVKEIVTREITPRSALITLEYVESHAADDWAVFKRIDGGEFASSVKICPEYRLPSASLRAPIGIKDFPVGLFDTSSTAKLTVASVQAKVYQYEKKLPVTDTKSSRKRSAQFVMQIGDVAEPLSPAVEVVIMVDGERVSGSCGAPYFNAQGEVVAFHFESVDDSDTNKSSSRSSSHVSYSHGYVLCRIPTFVEWYERSIGPLSP